MDVPYPHQGFEINSIDIEFLSLLPILCFKLAASELGISENTWVSGGFVPMDLHYGPETIQINVSGIPLLACNGAFRYRYKDEQEQP